MNIRKIIWNCRFISDKKRIEWYPGFWLMRIKVLALSPCWREIRLLLPQSWIATNDGGSMFGGFQACLADPIAAMACVHLFPGYSIWTRSLDLDFRLEGRTDLELHFRIDPGQEATIRQELQRKGRSTPTFKYGYYSLNGQLCTCITASIAIRQAGYRKSGKA